ncbi:MAG: ABC transporter substrate-binding protein [Verrucomicrobiales bacterium]|nr:ABC transporter substrate-binding protein [Verrucomicrobiales bacterium]
MLRLLSLLIALVMMALASCKKEEVEKVPIVIPDVKVIRVGVTANLGAAPILIAEKQGLFGKANVELSLTTHSTTEEIREQLTNGQLDIGMLSPAEALLSESAVIVPHILTRNGGQISVTEELWNQMQSHMLLDADGDPVRPISADALLRVAQAVGNGNPPLTFSVASLHDTIAYTLCYWLGAAGVTPIMSGVIIESPHPHLDRASIAVSTAPSLRGSAQGFTGTKHGKPVITTSAILRDVPTSVLACSESWAEANRETLITVVAALIEAGQWLDASSENRTQARADLENTLPHFGKDISHMVTFGTNASAAPDQNHALWIATQMMRWGHLPGSLTDAELEAMVLTTYRPDIFRGAAASLKAPLQGLEMRLEEQSLAHLIDGNVFISKRPSAYARSFDISAK